MAAKTPERRAEIGLATPPLDAMQSMAELAAAWTREVGGLLSPLIVKGCNVVDRIHAKLLPSPFLSLVIQDCVARGVDVTAGGAHYNFSGVQGVQIANVADSLVAIEVAVLQKSG